MRDSLGDIARGLPQGTELNSLAGGFALWASVSEGRATRAESSRDLLALTAAVALGAASFIVLAPWLQYLGHAGPELTLTIGAFLVGYLRRFGITGAAALLAYGAQLSVASTDRSPHSTTTTSSLRRVEARRISTQSSFQSLSPAALAQHPRDVATSPKRQRDAGYEPVKPQFVCDSRPRRAGGSLTIWQRRRGCNLSTIGW